MSFDPRQYGWVVADTNPFVHSVGQVWTRGVGAEMQHGLVVDASHGNHRAIAHGGVIMTLTECALSALASTLLGRPAKLLQLDVQFLSAGEQGEFLTVSGTTLRRSSSLVFLRGEVQADQKIVAAASGVWKTAPRPGAQSTA